MGITQFYSIRRDDLGDDQLDDQLDDHRPDQKARKQSSEKQLEPLVTHTRAGQGMKTVCA